MKNILKTLLLTTWVLMNTLAAPSIASESRDNQAAEDGHAHEGHADGDEHAEGETGHDEAEHADHAQGEEHADSEDPHDRDTGGAHDDHKGDAHAHGEEESGIALTTRQRQLASIEVTPLQPRTFNQEVRAPGEIQTNGYTSFWVSPRVDSVVIRRHAALGDHVRKGQSLITLFSESVAEAQAAYRVAAPELARVQQLGRRTVGEKRYVETRAEYEAARARLLAFGLGTAALERLEKDSAVQLGQYALVAEIDGAVLADDFHQGQRVEAGMPLMQLADESRLWVEARLAPGSHLALPAGTSAEVRVDGDVFPATVVQEAHTIDPETRTRTVRLEIDNRAHRLHPGQFADVAFTFQTDSPVLAVPEAALLRSADGDWVVFVEEEAGRFEQREVTIGRALGEWREISGIPVGTKVVTRGAFFVASQIAKGGFDPHNH